MQTNKPCITSCDFQKFVNMDTDEPWCSYYGKLLHIDYIDKKVSILRCTECVEDEKDWAVEHTLRQLTEK